MNLPTQIIIGILPTMAIAGLIGYYFLMFKPKHDEKAISKATGAKDIVPAEPGATDYSAIIDDYPTYHRQVK